MTGASLAQAPCEEPFTVTALVVLAVSLDWRLRESSAYQNVFDLHSVLYRRLEAGQGENEWNAKPLSSRVCEDELLITA